MTFRTSRPTPARQPAFNLPPVVLALIGAMVLIHVAREWLLSDLAETWVVLNFAFIPARFDAFGGAVLPVDVLPGAGVWTFVTYAFLHGSFTHLLLNVIWLAAFGSPLAWRFGPWRFLLFSAVGAIAGATVHLGIYPGEAIPLVGASAAISAHMAGAMRFLFVGQQGQRNYYAPAAPLSEVFTDRNTLTFIAVWFGISIVIGLVGFGAGSDSIAWQAHIGGFIAGLLLFRVFDPVRPWPGPRDDERYSEV